MISNMLMETVDENTNHMEGPQLVRANGQNAILKAAFWVATKHV